MSLVPLSQPPSRSKSEIAFLIAAATAGALLVMTLPVLPVAKALAISAAWVMLLALMFVVGRSRRVHFDPDNRRIIVRWRNFVLAERRKEIPLNRFGSVLSYCAMGRGSANWVCLVERTGGRGVHIASYGITRKARSFWDLVPAVVETPGARDLRAWLCSTLELRDGGFVPALWPPKESK
jgi:hypothetical protein